jgi:hypothetical protein
MLSVYSMQRKDELPDLRRVVDAPGVHLTPVSFEHHHHRGATHAAPHNNHLSSAGAGSVRNAAVHACVFASVVTKQAAELAFAQKGRSMTASDVVEHIGEAFRVVYPEG